MEVLKDLLPPAKSTFKPCYDHSNDPWFKQFTTSGNAEKSDELKPNPVPSYLKRASFVPRKVEDFGDGGAFPEIHVAQYPLDIGRDRSLKPGSKILPVTVDARGNVAHDAIVKQNENSKKIVYSRHKDLIPEILKNEEDEYEDEESQKEIEETTLETRNALKKFVSVRLSAAKQTSGDSKFIKYAPSQNLAAFNSGARERIIRMVETLVDPFEPPKFKHKRVPKPSGSLPVPIMHSPPRPVTVKDQKDWKIPPCISNWKNPKGYVIPLDKRLAADGRGLHDVQVGENRAVLMEALYAAERKCREATEMKIKVLKEMEAKEKDRKSRELLTLARRARAERTAVMTKETMEEKEEKIQRGKIREERKRERRLEAREATIGKKSKITRDGDRDISEKVVLGMPSVGSGRAGEVMYDQRLFNQEKGMSSGFAAEDQYNVYDKTLFAAQSTLSTLYRPKKDTDAEMYGGAEEQLDKIVKTERFKPDRSFSGASEKGGRRDGPVEFQEVAVEADDPFGLDQFLTEVNKGKRVMENVGTSGTMRASAGSSMHGGGGFGRARIGFQRGH